MFVMLIEGEFSLSMQFLVPKTQNGLFWIEVDEPAFVLDFSTFELFL